MSRDIFPEILTRGPVFIGGKVQKPGPEVLSPFVGTAGGVRLRLLGERFRFCASGALAEAAEARWVRLELRWQ